LFRAFSHFETIAMSFVPVRVFDNYISAHIAMGRLQEDGINCWLKDENTVTIDPILTNAVGGIKLMVDSSQSEKAAAILRTIDNEYKAAHPCPKCNSLNIELVSTPRKASNWASFIIGLLFTSYAPKIVLVYHCFNCGNEYPFEEKQESAS
jgi:predicted RNA-binding Zn-ribbon protein involved in translation (DUF1610 family)